MSLAGIPILCTFKSCGDTEYLPRYEIVYLIQMRRADGRRGRHPVPRAALPGAHVQEGGERGEPDIGR
jgi:hypothetical protein